MSPGERGAGKPLTRFMPVPVRKPRILSWQNWETLRQGHSIINIPWGRYFPFFKEKEKKGPRCRRPGWLDGGMYGCIGGRSGKGGGEDGGMGWGGGGGAVDAADGSI